LSVFIAQILLGGGKAFILTGDKANGNSTLLEVVIVMLGEDNISNLDLKNIDERFKIVELYGKLANIGDDISNEYKGDTSTFKKIVTGNAVTAENKGEKSFSFTPYSKLIFCANTTPRMDDKTGAVQRRLQIIPFNARFSETDEDYDPLIVLKLKRQPAIEYLIKLGVEGLKRVLDNRRFNVSSKVQDELNEYERENNPVKAFVEEFGLDNITNEPTDNVYENYEGFCIKTGFKGMFNKLNFSKQLKTHYNITTRNTKFKGKDVRVYVTAD